MSRAQWDRITLGGVEFPQNMTREKLKKQLRELDWRSVFAVPDGCKFEIITPSGDDLARWESEGGAL